MIGIGVALVVVTMVEVIWTTIAAGSGAGPVTSRATRSLWAVALAIHGRRPSHRLLTAAGVGITASMLALWMAMVLVGWVLIFDSAEGAVRSASTAEPAPFVSRVYFVGYTVFTLGNGEFVPGDGAWQIATATATGTGLILITVSITYLVPVAGAVAQRRQLGSYIASLGGTPHEIITRAWNGDDFGALADHLVALTPLVHDARQRHLTYPMLHYFHSSDVESALGPNIANLDMAIQLLHFAVASNKRPEPAATEPLDRAVASFLETLRSAFFRADDDGLRLPALSPLREAGIPTVHDEEFEQSASETAHRRQLLAGLLKNDGWTADLSELT